MRKIGNACMAVFIMIFIISLAVILTLGCRNLYYYDINALDIVEESGYSEEEIRANYDVLIDYNLSPFQDKLEFPTFPMSEEGEIHFREVKNIFQFFLKLFLISGVIVVPGTIIQNKRRDYLYLKWASVITIVIPAVIGLMVAVYWEKTFVLFHELMFDNDYWIFDSVTDPVITILPDEFFMHCAFMVVGLVALGAMGCYVSWRYKRKNNNIK